MLPMREYIYFGTVIGLLIMGLITLNFPNALAWAIAGGVTGGIVGYIVWRLRRV